MRAGYDAALRGLTGILHDDEHGGWYPQVFADGTHARARSAMRMPS